MLRRLDRSYSSRRGLPGSRSPSSGCGPGRRRGSAGCSRAARSRSQRGISTIGAAQVTSGRACRLHAGDVEHRHHDEHDRSPACVRTTVPPTACASAAVRVHAALRQAGRARGVGHDARGRPARAQRRRARGRAASARSTASRRHPAIVLARRGDDFRHRAARVGRIDVVASRSATSRGDPALRRAAAGSARQASAGRSRPWRRCRCT